MHVYRIYQCSVNIKDHCFYHIHIYALARLDNRSCLSLTGVPFCTSVTIEKEAAFLRQPPAKVIWIENSGRYASGPD